MCYLALVVRITITSFQMAALFWEILGLAFEVGSWLLTLFDAYSLFWWEKERNCGLLLTVARASWVACLLHKSPFNLLQLQG